MPTSDNFEFWMQRLNLLQIDVLRTVEFSGVHSFNKYLFTFGIHHRYLLKKVSNSQLNVVNGRFNLLALSFCVVGDMVCCGIEATHCPHINKEVFP